MGTQTDNTSSQSQNMQFNPVAQGAYNSMVGSGSNVLNQYMQNPLSNPMYNLGLQQSMKGASQAGQNNMGALQSQMKTSGMGGTAGQGFQTAQTAQMGRANQAMSSQANMANVMQALQRQMSATGMGMSFSPQMTGTSGSSQSQTSTGGLGTWLPQLLGAAGGMMTGGLSSMLGGATSALTPGPGASSGAPAAPFSPLNMPTGSSPGGMNPTWMSQMMGG